MVRVMRTSRSGSGSERDPGGADARRGSGFPRWAVVVASALGAAGAARAIVAAWARQTGEGVETVDDGGCYREGCFVTFTFTDARAAERFHDQVTAGGDPSSSWLGPRVQLEPLSQPGGKRKVTWTIPG